MAAATALGLSLAAGCSQAGGPAPLAAMANPMARPGRLVALPDGRKLNLRCSGRGSPTVLLESGFGAGSSAWVKVQPLISSTTQACSYDRAGYGFSDPGPLPRDAAAVARDLDQALRAANIRGPFIVVGHSAGGLYARVFAARRPRDVAGLILLDPTVEHRMAEPARDGLDGLRNRVRHCLSAALTAPDAPFTDDVWSGCAPARPNAHDVMVTRRTQTWQTQLSELDELFMRSSDQVQRAYGQVAGVPTYVITATQTATSSGAPALDGRTPLEIAHEAIAQVSRNGSQRTVTSSHLVMIDRPDVVQQAVDEMVRAARAKRPPAPLPASEAPVAPDTDILRDLFANPRGLVAPSDPPAPYNPTN